MNNEKDQVYVLKINERLNTKDWNFERKEILREAVKELKTRGYSGKDIKELFKLVSLKEQDNSRMVSNNARYLELLDEILNS